MMLKRLANSFLRTFLQKQKLVYSEMTNQEFVELCYKVILERSSDETGRLNYTNALDSGLSTRETVLIQIAESQEYQNKKYSLAQTEQEQKNIYRRTSLMNNEEFVEFCHQKILRRTADESGKLNYLRQLDSGEIIRESLLLQLAESEEFQLAVASDEFVYPGHFFSAVPSLEDIENFVKFEAARETDISTSIPGVELNTQKQIELLSELQRYFAECPFPEWKTDEFRYYFANPAYGNTDGLILYSMICHFKPSKIMVVGSGFSSCAILDTNQHFFNNKIELTFLEPYPDLLYSLISYDEQQSNNIIANKLQDVDLNLFRDLEENDILFIDSTHVSKLNSDVNRIFFEILPRLEKGVIIHFHDIFWPFEYCQEWIREGRAWNEIYMLRTFLEFNPCFEIIFFFSYLKENQENLIQQTIPRHIIQNGTSCWLRKIL
ncbi:DUF4214 domain-containing protein [Nostoc sp. LEGE 06077]|uniref:DUF4214 domain-containing protein n=1 Tax=Nostoc sp. LEGE 06077 TaxID=915325 RepID=UPI0018805A38|nr:DUF4214 domain-containing protein [Nostoc sp. LEGE 06077]MBE9210928.1 DUF4214 domain-containing protein [Nostoc sp. LEGE 06077]